MRPVIVLAVLLVVGCGGGHGPAPTKADAAPSHVTDLSALQKWADKDLGDYKLLGVVGTQTALGELDVWAEAEHRQPKREWEGVNGEPHTIPAKTTPCYVVFTYRVVKFDDGQVKYLRRCAQTRSR